MVDQLSESAVRLAKSEREQAWREMAKQVAHEIKNPLTPMRLSVQSFEQQFDPNDPKSVSKKIEEFSSTLDSSNRYVEYHCLCLFQFCRNACARVRIAGCGQNHPTWPWIFLQRNTSFLKHPNEPLLARLDRTQLIRILTNLVKNAIQACDEVPKPSVVVRVQKKNDKVCICVTDNGHGIARTHQ